ncbi:hypothetical protein HY024_00260 [Candidatus Curtissbacteria bacterium]|nr:hypothetical protein [Candidatus Curtissbacteria bacterium]
MNNSDDSGDPIADKAKSPSVLGEEDPYSGDASDSVAVDIDEELAKVGLTGDKSEEVKPLGVDEELD